MARWQPDARGRLEQAAMELYGERGFEQTTVAQIAERAGLTERTFFRYFADKREVLFGGTDAVRRVLVDAVRDAPASSAPFEALAEGLRALAQLLDEQRGRSVARRRHRIIASNDELRERELSKLSAWARALAGALRARGVEETSAALLGEVGLAVFRAAFERWVATARGRTLPGLVDEALAELDALTAAGAAARGS